MKRVYVAANIIDAHLLKDYLCGAGIEAMVKGEYLVGAIGELPTDAYPTVWITDPTLFDQAQALVRRYERDRDSDQLFHDGWVCPDCGELLEAQFTQCWQCGRHRL